MEQDIFEFVKSQETLYKTTPIAVTDGFEWSMYEHIRKCIMYKDGVLLTGNRDDKPVKNIILPILNVHYRTEGFDVKDIEPYVNDEKNYHKSFLVRKYHDKWAIDNHVDEFIDDIVMSYVDFGGVLVKNGKSPEMIPLQKLAFCDQTDILSGPFAIKHQYTIDQVQSKSNVWDKTAIEDVIDSAQPQKTDTQNTTNKPKTPGKYVEIYEVHGVFPNSWLLKDNEYKDSESEDSFSNQVHIICYNFDSDSSQTRGVCLYKGKEKPGNFKLLKRDKRFGTTLGRSAIEELFEPQVWTNYNMIQIKKMLDKASLMLGITDDPTFASKNNFTDLEQGEWLVKQPNTSIEPFEFPTVNLAQYENSSIMWEQHARTLGSASDPQLGLNPSSGTPLGTTQIITNQGEGIHEYRRGQIASFVAEIYRDWFIPKLVEEMNQGQTFVAELSLEELQTVADKVVTNHVNDKIKEQILAGKLVTQEEVDAYSAVAKQVFMKDGQRKFHQILVDDLKKIPVDVFMNIAGKEKNQQAYVDKLSNIMRTIFSNPMVLQDPNVVKLLNSMLEASGLSPINFSMTQNTQQQPQNQPQQTQPQVSPIQNLTTGVQ